MKDNISPEEKLLRLIRKEKIPQAQAEKRPAPGARYLPFFNLRRMVLIAFAASLFYLIASFIYPWFGRQKINLPAPEPEKLAEPDEEPGAQIKPYEFYLQGIRGRQVFGNSSGQEAEEPESVPKINVDVDLVKEMNLIGIISGEAPQAIIEDKRTQKTYYLGKGQFTGEVQVEDIQEGKVILNYQGQKFELYL